MKRIRANDIGSALESRTLDLGVVRAVGVLGVALCITVMNLTLLSGSSHAAEPTLAPLVLFDTDEIATYLDEFPKDDYRSSRYQTWVGSTSTTIRRWSKRRF